MILYQQVLPFEIEMAIYTLLYFHKIEFQSFFYVFFYL